VQLIGAFGACSRRSRKKINEKHSAFPHQASPSHGRSVFALNLNHGPLSSALDPGRPGSHFLHFHLHGPPQHFICTALVAAHDYHHQPTTIPPSAHHHSFPYRRHYHDHCLHHHHITVANSNHLNSQTPRAYQKTRDCLRMSHSHSQRLRHRVVGLGCSHPGEGGEVGNIQAEVTEQNMW
jgi:hypothetical protein